MNFLTFKDHRRNAVVLLGLLLLTAGSQAEPQNSREVIEGRQANLRDLGGAYKEFGDQLKKAKPMAFILEQYATQINDFAKAQTGWYPKGTGPETGIKMEAKAEIWTRPEEFSKAIQRLIDASAKLSEVTAQGDVKLIKAEHRKVGETCKGCHDVFREEKE